MDDFCKAKRVYDNGKKQLLICGAATRKSIGHIGALQCEDENDMKVSPMTPAWEVIYPSPEKSCGGEHYKDKKCTMSAPGFENANVIMIDDFTYMTYLHMP